MNLYIISIYQKNYKPKLTSRFNTFCTRLDKDLDCEIKLSVISDTDTDTTLVSPVRKFIKYNFQEYYFKQVSNLNTYEFMVKYDFFNKTLDFSDLIDSTEVPMSAIYATSNNLFNLIETYGFQLLDINPNFPLTESNVCINCFNIHWDYKLKFNLSNNNENNISLVDTELLEHLILKTINDFWIISLTIEIKLTINGLLYINIKDLEKNLTNYEILLNYIVDSIKNILKDLYNNCWIYKNIIFKFLK